MIIANKSPKRSKVVIMGITFKENCPDTRNSKVEDIINRLKEFEIDPIVVEPWSAPEDAMKEYGVSLTPISETKDADCIIFAVAHDEFKDMSLSDVDKLYKASPAEEKLLIDVKGIFDKADLGKSGYTWWRL